MPYSRSDYRDKWRIERTAATVRRQLGLDQYEPLRPLALAEAIPAHVFYPEDFGDDTLAKRLRRVNWDGLAFHVQDDPTLMVLLNPARPKTRQTATLMEEFSHHLLGHRPTSIVKHSRTGLPQRSYDPSQEAEAYDLGAAILLPKERIQRDVGLQRTAADIADPHNCSHDLVTYRIKRLRLWQRYVRYAAA